MCSLCPTQQVAKFIVVDLSVRLSYGATCPSRQASQSICCFGYSKSLLLVAVVFKKLNHSIIAFILVLVIQLQNTTLVLGFSMSVMVHIGLPSVTCRFLIFSALILDTTIIVQTTCKLNCSIGFCPKNRNNAKRTFELSPGSVVKFRAHQNIGISGYPSFSIMLCDVSRSFVGLM